MTTPATKTSILLTGANGSLGTYTALQIAKHHPISHHLILAARNPTDVNSKNLTALLDALGNGVTYAFFALDLASLASTRAFVAELRSQLETGVIPPLHAIINCAARVAFTPEPYTVDGFHPIYQINYLAPWVLTTGLVGNLVEGKGMVVNVTSSARGMGGVGYFDDEGIAKGEPGEVTKEEGSLGGLTTYGSAKLMMAHPGKTPPSIILFDPGTISSVSRASTHKPLLLRLIIHMVSTIAPIARLLGTRSLFHDVEVPANALCKLVCEAELGGGRTGLWYLGDEIVGGKEEVGEEDARRCWERTVGVLGMEEMSV
ncbi:hypothetical protein FGG08_004283 [Glutinoglossum americanum]|uniref:3beta-hydroxysteroid 3-dehydrogenase n=1 Tax=Glutinoglossum americanum TaxID=1670608 RepID=A0A9P8I610_9PEZI|nr:hypothetical protein FGG08_004283 [Glutinoglossum americanum]